MRKCMLLVVTLLGLSIIGCNRRDQSSQSRKKSGKPRIALVMKALSNEFFKTMEKGAVDHNKQHAGDYELICNGIPDESDVAKQIALVEQMTAQEVDAIVIAPADSQQLILPCKSAIDKGIVVVNIDNKFDAKTLASVGISVPFVGPDNRQGSRMVGDFLAGKLKAGDEVVIIEGLRGAFNSEQRRLGFEDAMKAAGMKVVDVQAGDWDTTKAEKVVGALLPARANLKAILCANDSMAEGAVAAVQAAGKGPQILIVGYDNTTAAQAMIKAGKMLATADQHADQIAVNGIEYALAILQKKDQQTKVDLITGENLKR